MIAPAPFALHGKRAMVTGGNAGIGEAIALALARAGARVLLVARRADALEAAAQGLRAQGLRAATLAADLAALPGPGEGAAGRCASGSRGWSGARSATKGKRFLALVAVVFGSTAPRT